MSSTTAILTDYSSEKNDLVQFSRVLLCSFFIAIVSQISIPLPFTPIPITMQTFAIMLVGANLGSKKGALCVLIYLCEITLGLPVLPGGVSNPLLLFSIKGGYYLAFCLQAYLTGWFFERISDSSSGKRLLAIYGAALLQLSLGALWLGAFIGINNSLWMGIIPFIPGEFVKAVAIISIKKAR